MASDEVEETELTQTQSQSNNPEEMFFAPNPNRDEEKEIWGRLMAKTEAFRNTDLTSETFSAGRATSCDYCLSAPEIVQKYLLMMSKRHFKITRDLSDWSNPTYIEDCSRNGTFVNEERIGFQNKRILAHGDVISIAYPRLKAFTFKDHRRVATDLPKEVTKKYHIGKRLGAGACGTVFRVFDRACNSFALKQIKKNQLMDYKTDKALNEARIMKSLTHPCVVKMYDFLDSEDSVYITLELMKGGELLTRIQRKKYLSEPNSKLFFYQMCHAIKYLHDRKITHRDLKPDNILLSSSEENTLLKISDFGLSKLVKNNSALRTLCGTPLYVAPEVLLTNGRGEYTEKVDIWSLGVVLFTCLSGTLPFADDYGSPATEQIKRGQFQFRSTNWRSVSSTAKNLIREMLTTDVKKRPSIEELLKKEWLRDDATIALAHDIMNLPVPQPLEEQRPTSSSCNRTINSTVDLTVSSPPAKAADTTSDILFVRPYEVTGDNENVQPSKRRRLR